MCPQSSPKMLLQKKGVMEFRLYKKIIDEASSFIYDINLFLGGEPLLHKDIFSMIKYAKSQDIHVVLHTNATLLSREKIYQLLNSGVDVVSFSFDGYDKETYEKMRVNANFENTLTNLIEFLKVRERLGMKSPYTLLQILELNNISSLDDREQKLRKTRFLSNLRSPKFDEVFIARIHSWSGKIPGTQGQFLNTIYMPCRFPWFAMSIRWDGTVVACCDDFFDEYIVGNVVSDSLMSIWNNDTMLLLREKLAKGKYQEIKLCSKCNKLWVHRYSPQRFIPYGDIILEVLGEQVVGKLRKLRGGRFTYSG